MPSSNKSLFPINAPLRLRSIMIGRHFHANMKVQIAMRKDDNNSKTGAATNVKFVIYIYIMILVDYIQCIKYSIFNISVEFQDIKCHQS